MTCFQPRVKGFTPPVYAAHAGRVLPRNFVRLIVIGLLLAEPSWHTPLHAAEPLQTYVRRLMRGRRGAALVSNPVTGEVLAVSNPEVAFERAYPPGSTAKVVVSAVALEGGAVSSRDHILCRRVPELLGSAYHCSHPPATVPFTLTDALANSCNYCFAALSTRITSASLRHGYALFGFGSSAEGVGMKSNPGQVRVGDDATAKGRAALGEGTVLVTPAQLLLAYSAIANRGQVFRMWKSPSRQNVVLLRQVRLKLETFDILQTGLEECVRSGTGQGAAVEGVRVAGKTGTAAALDGSRATHAWFVGFAPIEAPEIALVVFLERGTGARDAAPLAGRILNHYFALKGRKR